MDQPNTNPSIDGCQPSPFGCDDATHLVRRFLAGAEVVTARASLRAHLAECDSCQASYRAAVETLAALANGARAHGASQRSAVRPARPRRMPADEELEGARWRGRSFATLHRTHDGTRRLTVAKFALPALGLYLALVFAGRDVQRPATLTASGGMVHIGDDLVRPGHEPARLARSQGATTTSDSRARIESTASHVVVEPSTAFAVERDEPLRLRLFEGQLIFDGTCVVATSLGIVEIENAAGVIRLDASGLDIALAAGAAAFQDHAGRTDVRPGRALHLDFAVVGSQ